MNTSQLVSDLPFWKRLALLDINQVEFKRVWQIWIYINPTNASYRKARGHISQAIVFTLIFVRIVKEGNICLHI